MLRLFSYYVDIVGTIRQTLLFALLNSLTIQQAVETFPNIVHRISATVFYSKNDDNTPVDLLRLHLAQKKGKGRAT